MNGQYNLGDTVLANWKLTREIGVGSFGRVFEAERLDFGTVYKSAVKIITIPQSQSEVTSARSEGMGEESVLAYFRSFVEEIVREFALMSELKGTANIVSYEDHTVVQHTQGIGWDIFIRMELLTPLLNHTVLHPFTRQDVMKLGMDICRALELCQKFNIVHRDIKPENIFVSKLGDYKLGDFGIARTVEKTTSGLSKKGTYTYMAPEVYRGEPYGSSVDIYSLGIVLYRMLNDNRAPFLPAAPAPITHGDREAALTRRIGGASLPVPRNADGRLAEIVLKACAYDPKDRYSSPMPMRQELEAILYSREEAPIIYPEGDAAPVEPVVYVEDPAPPAQLDASQHAAPAAHERTEGIFDDTKGQSRAESAQKPPHAMPASAFRPPETPKMPEAPERVHGDYMHGYSPPEMNAVKHTPAAALAPGAGKLTAHRSLIILAALSVALLAIGSIIFIIEIIDYFAWFSRAYWPWVEAVYYVVFPLLFPINCILILIVIFKLKKTAIRTTSILFFTYALLHAINIVSLLPMEFEFIDWGVIAYLFGTFVGGLLTTTLEMAFIAVGGLTLAGAIKNERYAVVLSLITAGVLLLDSSDFFSAYGGGYISHNGFVTSLTHCAGYTLFYIFWAVYFIKMRKSRLRGLPGAHN